MSFKLFIYYGALCGAWAAMVAWLLLWVVGLVATGKREVAGGLLHTVLITAVVGVLVAAAVGAVDAVLNAVGSERVVRVVICLGVGLVGGMIGGALGQVLANALAALVVAGWMILGVAIGSAVGVYDLARAQKNRQAMGMARRKTLNGIIGGALGGFVGGLIYVILHSERFPRLASALGLVVLGAFIGFFIGLAQVILKEAWVKIEAGFRPGREMMLSKAETTIGRAESNDIGLFGDTGVEKAHARIVLEKGRYLLEPAAATASTFLNDARVEQRTPLRSGDLIRVGNSLLRFGERRKQPSRR